MKIRGLKWKGVSMWPPEWWISDHGAGEEGILTEVHFRKHRTPECIYVIVDHRGEIRKGIIVLEDPYHLEILYRKLKDNRGRPLTEIGDLEIDLRSPFLKHGPKQVRLPQDPGGKNLVLNSK
jgi:hypothetical protein